MKVSRFVAPLAVVLAVPTLASADLLFDGSEFQINTYPTSSQDGATVRAPPRDPAPRRVDTEYA